jgi:hypothetical protein
MNTLYFEFYSIRMCGLELWKACAAILNDVVSTEEVTYSQTSWEDEQEGQEGKDSEGNGTASKFVYSD